MAVLANTKIINLGAELGVYAPSLVVGDPNYASSNAAILQQALYDAYTNGSYAVKMPAGEIYYDDSLVVYNRCRLEGMGQQVTTLRYIGEGPCIRFDDTYNTTFKGVRVKGFSLRGNQADPTNHGFEVTTKFGLNFSNFEDIEIQDIGGDAYHFVQGMANVLSLPTIGTWATAQGANVIVTPNDDTIEYRGSSAVKIDVAAAASTGNLATLTLPSATAIFDLSTSGPLASSGNTNNKIATDLFVIIRPTITLYPGDIQFEINNSHGTDTLNLPYALKANYSHRIYLPFPSGSINTSYTATTLNVKAVVDRGAYTLRIYQAAMAGMGISGGDCPWWNQYLQIKTNRSGFFDYTREIRGHFIYARGGFSTNRIEAVGMCANKGSKLVKPSNWLSIPENNIFDTIDPQASSYYQSIHRCNNDITWTNVDSNCSLINNDADRADTSSGNNYSAHFQIKGTVAAGTLVAYSALQEGLTDLYDFETICFSAKNGSAKSIPHGTYQLLLSADNTFAAPLARIDIPALREGTGWLNFNDKFKSVVKEVSYIGLYKALEDATDTDLRLDNIYAMHTHSNTTQISSLASNSLTDLTGGGVSFTYNTTDLNGSSNVAVLTVSGVGAGQNLCELATPVSVSPDSYTHVGVWIQCSIDTSAGDLMYRAAGAASLDFEVPALAAGYWKYVCLPIQSNTYGNITQFRLKQMADLADCTIKIALPTLMSCNYHGMVLDNVVNTSFVNGYNEGYGAKDPYGSQYSIMVKGSASKGTSVRNVLFSAYNVAVYAYNGALDVEMDTSTANYSGGCRAGTPIADYVNRTDGVTAGGGMKFLGGHTRFETTARKQLLDISQNAEGFLEMVVDTTTGVASNRTTSKFPHVTRHLKIGSVFVTNASTAAGNKYPTSNYYPKGSLFLTNPANMAKGMPLGYVLTSDMVTPSDSNCYPIGQVGHRTSDGSPVGSLTPNFIGEEILDTTNVKWYKSVGSANTDWVALN